MTLQNVIRKLSCRKEKNTKTLSQSKDISQVLLPSKINWHMCAKHVQLSMCYCQSICCTSHMSAALFRALGREGERS